MSIEVIALVVFAIGTGVTLLSAWRPAAIAGGVAGILYGAIVLLNHVR